ncbi:MAG: YfjI family protein, partial [Pirellulales bacterium]|nr:YfjI family protein [Pirellulales bacterium]
TAKGIYIAPNPVNPALLSRAANRIRKAQKGESTGDSDIVCRKWLLIDTDPQRASGISASEAEHQMALDLADAINAHLKDYGWPDPIIADSGNGAHLFYRIDLTAEDGELIKRCLQALAAEFDNEAVKVDQGVFNPARIWKLYGTLACKGDDTHDRPHRMARILSAPDVPQMVDIELLHSLATTAPTPTQQFHNRNGQSFDPFDVQGFIDRNRLDVEGPSDWSGRQGEGKCWRLNDSPLCEHGGDGPHILQHASGAISASCHHNSCDWSWFDLRHAVEPQGAGQRSQGSNHPTRESESRTVVNITQFQPFPTDALPEPVRGFVEAAAGAILCDASFVALPLLSVLSAAIGNTRRIELKRGWTAPAIIWTAVVGESGTGKTPAFKLVMAPVREQQGRALQAHTEKMKQYEASLLSYEKRLNDWKRDKKSNRQPPAKPDPPESQRFVVQDTTVEALAPLLRSNPRGLLLANDELKSWLGSFDRYAGGKGGADASHWLSMHNGESITVDRKSGENPTIFVSQALISITGGIQPGILHRALGNEHRESGLAARLLLACPPRTQKQWTENDIDPADQEELSQLINRLYELQSTPDLLGALSPVVLRLTDDAKATWIEFFNQHAEEQTDLNGELSAAYSKLEEYAARLALVIHCVRSAAADPDLESPDLVDATSMEWGIKLTRWFGSEAKRVYAMLSEDEKHREQRQLIEWIERKGGSVTAREVQQGHRRYKTAQDAAAALEELAAGGLGHWESSPTGQRGHPTRRFILPAVSTVYGNSENTDENLNTVDSRRVDTFEEDKLP